MSGTRDPGPSWSRNAAAWTEAVRSGSIESRRLATDEAIVRAVLERRPARALDLGCGEGWLARRLGAEGVSVLGVDAEPGLVRAARDEGGAEFLLLTYEQITNGALAGRSFDAVALNFALLEEDHAALLGALAALLTRQGRLVIQTLHPWSGRSEGPYRSGWREERFDAFEIPFPSPMPYFFRTLEDWVSLLAEGGLAVESIEEPRHPTSGEPLSLLLVACARRRGVSPDFDGSAGG